MIFALLQQKGGGGKTTLATHLAGALASPQSSVLVIDADPQAPHSIGPSAAPS